MTALWSLARPQRWPLAIAAGAAITQTAAGLTTPYLVQIAINQGMLARRAAVVDQVGVAFVAVAAVQFAAGRVGTLSLARAGERALYGLRSALFAHLQTLSLEFYERDRPGRVVARMTNDVQAMSFLVSDGLASLVTSVVAATAAGVIMFTLDWRLALVTLTVTPPLAICVVFFRRRSQGAWRLIRDAATAVTLRLQEVLTGVRAVQCCRRERTALADVTDAAKIQRRAEQAAVRLTALFFPGVEFAGSAAVVIVLAVGGNQVLSGQLQIGTLAAFLLYLGAFFGPVGQLLEFYGSAQAALAGAERVRATFALHPSVHPAAAPRQVRQVRGAIRLEQVRFGYAGPDVLHGVDLYLLPGRALALVGATGAGKSTIAKMITRCYDPREGRVSIDGVDLRALAAEDLRRLIGYVPQEGFLFSGTIRENIAFGRPDATDAQIRAAAHAIGAPLDLDAAVGERGQRLAAGECQLISLARAWLADPPVLVLDEVTSSLDEDAEARVLTAVRRLRYGRTTVMIAHRLAAALTADLVAVIDDGRVAEAGSVVELLSAGGRFAGLYRQWLAGEAGLR